MTSGVGTGVVALQLGRLNLDLLVAQAFNGVVLGMTFVLLAVGLTLIFGMMNIVNFAHGALLLLGAYAAWTVTAATGSIVAGIVGAPVAVAAVGVGIERFGITRIYEEELLIQLLLTFGIAEMMTGVVEVVWGRTNKQMTTAELGGSVDLAVFTYPFFRLFVIAVAAAAIGALYLFLTRSDYGLVVRGAIQDREMTAALGIDVGRAFAVVFAIGAGLAGLAGALVGPIRGVYPALGAELLVPAFVVVVVGGMGSLKGSVVSGLALGQVVSFTSLVYPAASQVVIYVAMAVVLLVRPRGLFGEEAAEI
jgi:branched-subunit amino acid ABC-type transport system permease component